MDKSVHDIIVHGFMFDPDDQGGSNDPALFFEEIAGHLKTRNWSGFAWYSSPFGFRMKRPFYSLWQWLRAWGQAWFSGYKTPYAQAYANAMEAAFRLALIVQKADGPINLIGHSLGARVILQAFRFMDIHVQKKINAVLLLNGSELQTAAQTALDFRDANVPILNIAVKSDHVLSLFGSRFSGQDTVPCIGQAGLGDKRQGWHDLFLDDPSTTETYAQSFAWDLEGDNPESLLDHWYSYRYRGNFPLYQAWLYDPEFCEKQIKKAA